MPEKREVDGAGDAAEDDGSANASSDVSTPPPPAVDAGKLLALEAREKELVERLARLQADFDNYRRRTREDLSQATARGKLDFVKALIPALDNLDRALAHASDEGLQLLARHLRGTLSEAGLVVVSPEGEVFDAKLHEALASETKDGVKVGTILSVVERGYLLDGRVLRPARVVVAA